MRRLNFLIISCTTYSYLIFCVLPVRAQENWLFNCEEPSIRLQNMTKDSPKGPKTEKFDFKDVTPMISPSKGKELNPTNSLVDSKKTTKTAPIVEDLDTDSARSIYSTCNSSQPSITKVPPKGRLEDYGFLNIISTPSASEIWLNRIKYIDKSTMPIQLSPGTYLLKIKHSNYFPYLEVINIQKFQNVNRKIVLSSISSASARYLMSRSIGQTTVHIKMYLHNTGKFRKEVLIDSPPDISCLSYKYEKHNSRCFIERGLWSQVENSIHLEVKAVDYLTSNGCVRAIESSNAKVIFLKKSGVRWEKANNFVEKYFPIPKFEKEEYWSVPWGESRYLLEKNEEVITSFISAVVNENEPRKTKVGSFLLKYKKQKSVPSIGLPILPKKVQERLLKTIKMNKEE
jgi:hypothetical protein